MAYPWIKDSQYVTPPATGYLAVTSPNGLYAAGALNMRAVGDITTTSGGSTIMDADGNTITIGNGLADNIILNATDSIDLNGSQSVALSCATGNVNLTTPEGVVYINRNLVNTGNGTLNAGTINASSFVGALTGNASTATRATNIAGGLGGQIPYQSAANTTALLANGTAGQVLTSAGTTLAPTWVTPSAGSATTISITDTTTGTYYLTFVSASGSGQTLRADISTSPLSYNPSTGVLTTTTFAGALTTTSQLIMPNTLTSTLFNISTGVLTRDFGGFSTGIFTATLTANMTGIAFSGGRTGGQYVIYVSASGGTRTIASSLTPTATTKTNYATAISVLTTSVAILTVTYDGTNYLIAGSAFNSTQTQALTDAVFEYSPDGVSWFTIPSGGTGVTYDGNSYQFRVFSVSPSGATYSSSIPSPISQQGQTAQLSVTGTGSYTGTITSGIFTIGQRTLLAYYAPGGSSPVSADSCVVDGSVAEFNFSLENLVGFDAGVSVNIIYGTSYNQSSGEIRQPAPVGSSFNVGYVNDQYGSGNNFIVTTTSNVAVYCNENENYRGQYWWIVINPYQWEDDTGVITNNPAYNNNYTSPIVSVSGSNAFFDNTCV